MSGLSKKLKLQPHNAYAWYLPVHLLSENLSSREDARLHMHLPAKTHLRRVDE
jgi:hypothetical protein